jgi:phosphatidylserine synthase
VLARAVRVRECLPWFNGAKLDDIVDYLTYVFVPALFVWRSLLVPATWTIPVASAMLLSSAYGFNREDAKTSDHFFTGFPSYWNIVVFYLFVMHASQTLNAIILLVLAGFVFIPIRYLYPSRTPYWRVLTIILGLIWGAMLLALLWCLRSCSGDRCCSPSITSFCRLLSDADEPSPSHEAHSGTRVQSGTDDRRRQYDVAHSRPRADADRCRYR